MYARPAQIDELYGADIVVGSKNHEAKIGWLQSPADPDSLL